MKYWQIDKLLVIKITNLKDGIKKGNLFCDNFISKISVGPNRTDVGSFEGYGIATILLRFYFLIA